jgi:hypothetical protein
VHKGNLQLTIEFDSAGPCKHIAVRWWKFWTISDPFDKSAQLIDSKVHSDMMTTNSSSSSSSSSTASLLAYFLEIRMHFATGLMIASKYL